MSGLLLVAASGLAREVLAFVHELDGVDDVVVLDDDPARWGTVLDGHPVVGGLDLVREHDGHRVLLCAGRGVVRRALAGRLSALGVGPDRYATVVHPRVHVPRGCRVGRGSILLEGVVMTAGVTVGDHVVAMPHVTMTHDDVVRDHATLCAGVTLGGAVTVGSGAYLGMSSSVREGVAIGEDAVLGMGSALLTPLPARETWGGVPARPIRTLVEVES